MTVWTNVDPAFVVGLIILLAIAIDAAIQGSQRTFRQSLLLFQAAFLCTFLNPQSYGLWFDLLRWPRNPLIPGLAPVSLGSIDGVLMMVALVVFAVQLFRARRVCLTSCMLVGATLVLCAVHSRFVMLLVPITVWRSVLIARPGLSAASFGNELSHYATSGTGKLNGANPNPQPMQFAWSLIAVLVLWIGFTVSPASDPLLADRPRELARIVSRDLPLGAHNVVSQQSRGLVWSPWYWSDWLMHGQSPTSAHLFCGSRLEELPLSARRDYFRIAQADGEWRRIADKYAIRTIVLDKLAQQKFVAGYLRDPADWSIGFEDRQTLVLVRKGV